MISINNLYCFIGRSGSGKDTIVSQLTQQYGYKKLLSYTTRPRRPNEEGTHTFIEAGKVSINPGDPIVAYDTIYDNLYFCTESQLFNSDFYVVNLKGYRDVCSYCNLRKGIKLIYVRCDDEIVAERMRERGDTQQSIKERLEQDKKLFPDQHLEICAHLIVDTGCSDTDDIIQQIHNFIQQCEQESAATARKPLVYLAHPLGSRGNFAKNESNAENDLYECWSRFHPEYSFVSPISAFGKYYDTIPYNDGMDLCLQLLARCDELWVSGKWNQSRGCLTEVQFAIDHDIPVKKINHAEYSIQPLWQRKGKEN